MLLVYTMALESLRNPLSQLNALPRSVNFATAEEVGPNDPYYSATHQYVKNDMCLSAVTEGAYVFLGGSTNKTATFGGLDPSADANWVGLEKVGANSVSGPFQPVATGAAVPAYTMTFNTLTVPENSRWLVSWRCVATAAAPMVGLDWIRWTLTAGVNSVAVTHLPTVDTIATSSAFSATVLVTVPPGTTSIVLSGVTAPSSTSAALTVTATSLVGTRLD